MSWYELLLFLHVLAIATWFGSAAAIMVLATRALGVGGAPFGTFAVNAGWWASRAHPAAGVVLLLTGFGMVADANYSMGETWLTLALIGLVVAFGIGGALIGKASGELTKRIEAGGGSMPADARPVADRLILYSRIELAVLVLVIADMVAKPGA